MFDSHVKKTALAAVWKTELEGQACRLGDLFRRWLEPGWRGQEMACSLEVELTGPALFLGSSPTATRTWGWGPEVGLSCHGLGTALLLLELPRDLGKVVPNPSLPFPGAAGKPFKGLPMSSWR